MTKNIEKLLLIKLKIFFRISLIYFSPAYKYYVSLK